ncbi:MAG TPA: hypothetical protein VMG09_04940 [Bacteroidota bacterium]|nr:hypothetical protein [Bacteroidota bacterium]
MALPELPTSDGLENLRDQLSQEPDNLSLRAKYFWSLHQRAKSLIEENAVPLAASCALEMGRCFIATDKAANAMGWLVHRVLRAWKEDPRRHQLAEEDFSALTQVYLQTIPFVPGPDKMHSAILWVTSQVQGEEGWRWFVQLTRAIGTERMQAEDFEGKEVNGYPLPSLAERVVLAAAKIVVQNRDVDDGEWALSLVEGLLAKKPQSLWLKFQRGRLLILLGRVAEAQEFVRPVVVAKRAEFWAWAVLGESFIGSDDNKAVACFCKVITLKDDEVFLLGIRELLAKALLNLGRASEAKAEIARALMVRRSKNLRIPQRLLACETEAWFTSSTAADNAALYLDEARKADDLLFEGDPTYVGIVTNIDQKSRSCFITFRLDGSARYRYHRSPWEKNLPEPGTAVLVRIRELPSEQQSRFEAVSMQPTTETPDRSFAREFSGSLKLITKADKDPIGFVSDIFIPGALLKLSPFPSGALLKGTAVKEMNRARGEHGWRAVRVSLVETKKEFAAPPPPPPPPETPSTPPPEAPSSTEGDGSPHIGEPA